MSINEVFRYRRNCHLLGKMSMYLAPADMLVDGIVAVAVACPAVQSLV